MHLLEYTSSTRRRSDEADDLAQLVVRMLRTVLSGRSSRTILAISLATNTILLLLGYCYFTSDVTSCEKRERTLHFPPVSAQYNLSTLAQAVDETVFVGGVPRSGTTLVRAMLDAHPDVRCGEETRVIPRIISMRSRWSKSQKESNRLKEAGLSEFTLDSATRAFISEIILNHGKLSRYLCNKDPLVLNYMPELSRIFPRSKFLLMVRDGRAVAYSIVSRNVTISSVDSKSYMSAALFWNKVVQRMSTECVNHRDRCVMVHYEDLVSDPRKWMTSTLKFLGIPWHENVLKHHQLIDSEVSLSK